LPPCQHRFRPQFLARRPLQFFHIPIRHPRGLYWPTGAARVLSSPDDLVQAPSPLPAFVDLPIAPQSPSFAPLSPPLPPLPCAIPTPRSTRVTQPTSLFSHLPICRSYHLRLSDLPPARSLPRA
jgi:hypothetical protein